MILLDTNLLSELMKPTPDKHVLAWFAAHPADTLFLSTITEAELRFGITLLPAGKRRQKLAAAIAATLEEDFAGRILPFDTPAAIAYAEIASTRQGMGRPISQFDCQIAAITRARNASLATRNTGDFTHCDIPLMNPWVSSDSIK